MGRIWPLTLRGTGALVLTVACFVLANQLGLIELVYFGVLLVAVLVTAFASLYLVRRSESVGRSISPDVPTVGAPATVTVHVGVRTALPTAPGTWRDSVPKTVTAAARGPFPAIGSGLRGGDRTVELSYDLSAVSRGIHWLGPLQVTSTDPFGLVRRSGIVGERTRMTVAPEVVDLPLLSSYAGESGGTLRVTAARLGQGADNLIARPYAPGDSMRRIHWRASAHRDALMVRQEEQESNPQAVVVFDRSLTRWTPAAMTSPGADAGFETGLSACVSAVARLVREGYAVEVLDTDGTALWDPIDGDDIAQVEAMTTRFATLVARRDDHLDQIPALFSGVLTGPVILIAGRFDPQDADALAAVPHHSALPILMAVAPTGDALDRAAASGWHTAAITPTTDLASAWATAADRGASHVLG